MHLVLIHWKIIRSEQAVQDFLRYWSEVLTVPDHSGLVAEFLSAPMRPEETGLFYQSIALQDTPEYYSFINVGLWEDVTAFKEAIDRPYRRRGTGKLPFEHEKCQGILLQPIQWRLGDACLHTTSLAFESLPRDGKAAIVRSERDHIGESSR
jgi:hypothetical protein